MRHWGIRRKVFALAVGPAALMALVLTVHFVNSRVSDLEQSLQARGLAIARQLAPASEYGVFAGNREVLKKLAEAAVSETDVDWVAITDVDNNVLAEAGKSHPPPGLASYQVGLNIAIAETRSALVFSAPIFLNQINVEDVSDAARDPVRSSMKVLGRVNIEMSRASTQVRENELVRNGLIIGIVGLLFTAALAARMSRQVTRPVLRLAQAVKQIGEGQLNVKVPEDSGGELQVLERGINAMTATLKASRENLQERIDEATARLTYQASHDALTGLINRREFEVRLARALETARSTGHHHTLCYLDLDQFKVVNDTCGHVAGDELLRQLSGLLHGKLRDRDTLARLGGDEFGVLLENCVLEQAQPIADLLRQAVKDLRFVWQGRSFSVGVSIGLVALHGESGSLATLLSAADAACYAAKDRGRDRVHVYQEQDDELLRRRGEMQWVTRITQAMEENRLRLYVQPIVPVSTEGGVTAHCEFLLRMLDDGGEPILPMAFIPAAERYNLMPAIDRWVISTTFAHCGQIAAPTICTVNVSGHSLGDEHFRDFVERQFDLNGVPHGRVCFEITETAAISNLKEAVRFIEEFKGKGCLFSLDDFGAGLSSFAYLKHLPVDYLKIDGAFVRDMATDPMDKAMVEAINNIGHVMGLQTIAECVESEQILDELRRIGVDYAQGEWLKAPMPLGQFIGGDAGTA